MGRDHRRARGGQGARKLTPAWVRRIEYAATSPGSWAARAAAIRTQVLFSAGLWPEFDRPPLRSWTYGRREHDGITVEKVRIETWPGFQLCASLYRPATGGRHPAVLSFHGHWQDGRFTERDLSSLPGRAIALARLGCVVLSTDMVGYADTTQFGHKLGDVPWGINLLGLQLWNNIRCLDFLEALPDVDPGRIGVTGASGGATQTFLLAAVDSRVKVSVPVNMVSSGCQGGCGCENAPLLRIDLNNVEIAAAIAPRPLMLISCTGDWTAKTEERDATVAARAYAALGAPEKFRAATVDADHNYNRESRELANAWIARWLLDAPARDRAPESPFTPLPAEELTVWDAEHTRPADLRDADGFAGDMRDRIGAQVAALSPRDPASRERFRSLMLPALRVMLAARFPDPSDLDVDGTRITFRPLPGTVELRRDGTAPVISVVTETEAAGFRGPGRVLVLRPHEREAPVNSDEDTETEEWIAWRESHPLTYYRTELARRVQDVLTAVGVYGGPGVRLEARGEAALAVMLARPLIPADCIGTVDAGPNPEGAGDAAFWTGPRELPGILRIGGLPAVVALPGGRM